MHTFVADSRLGETTTDEGHRPRSTATVAEALRSPNRPLETATRSYFEPRLQFNFANVRIHADPPAARSAAELGVDPAPFRVARQVLDPRTGGEPVQPADGGPAIGAKPEAGQQEAPGGELIKPIAGADANPLSSTGGGGGDPTHYPDLSIFMGGRQVDHWLAGSTLGANHTYINVKQDASHYWLVEAGPLPSDPHTVGAWAKASQWEGRGNRIGSTYPDRAAFDRARTALFDAQTTYHSSSIKYDPSSGPNSNSFVEHMTTKAPFFAIFNPFDWQWNYWRSHARPF